MPSPDWLVGCAVLLALAHLYALPAVLGAARDAPELRRVVLLDLCWGWTVLGWWTALRLALRSPHGAAQPDRDERAWSVIAPRTASLGGPR